MESAAVNPRRKRRRKYYPPKRRRRRRRRRRNPSNPSTLRIMNPRGGGFTKLLMPAAMVTAGSLLGNVLPARVLKLDATKGKATRAAAAIGTGIVAYMLGSRFLGSKNAEYLALGAMSAGISVLTKDFLPPQWRLAGLGQEILLEEDIDEQMQRMAVEGIGADITDLDIDEDVSTVEGVGDIDDVSEMAGLGDEEEDAEFDEETALTTV